VTAKRNILLNPGPVTLTDRVRNALIRDDWCHREPEFAELTREINAELVSVYADMEADFSAVMLTGSGTSGVEAMLASFASDNGETLVLANGVYGERMAKMLAAHRKPYRLVQAQWTDPVDVAAAARVLDQHPEITQVATVHHETTTGRLNDLDAIGALCKARDLPLLLDGVSSFGAEAIDADGWNLAAVAATANKCLHAAPGLSFVVARNALWSEKSSEVGSVYLDLHAYYAGQHGEGFSPFTQAVPAAFALREALDELRDEGGWAGRRRIYRERAAVIAEALQSLNISMLLNENEYSCVLRSYLLPDGCDYESAHDAFKRAGFVIYSGQGQFEENIFRIANMGAIGADDLDALTTAFADIFGPFS
jgi:2-aminoethylphosphonate-pyruvate transaminase